MGDRGGGGGGWALRAEQRDTLFFFGGGAILKTGENVSVKETYELVHIVYSLLKVQCHQKIFSFFSSQTTFSGPNTVDMS
jgi:hypothetical protein